MTRAYSKPFEPVKLLILYEKWDVLGFQQLSRSTVIVPGSPIWNERRVGDKNALLKVLGSALVSINAASISSERVKTSTGMLTRFKASLKDEDIAWCAYLW